MYRNYSKDTLIIIGIAKPSKESPIYHQYQGYNLVFVIDKNTGEIIDVDSSVTLMVTRNFIKSIFIGHTFNDPIENIINEINQRYKGVSKNMMIVALKDAYKKYLSYK